MTESNYKVVMVTAPIRKAEIIGRQIVENKLAACANFIQNIKSIYWWEKKVTSENETLIIFKTKKDKLKDLENKLKELHPYEVPDIIVVDIEGGNNEYLKWIDNSI